MVSDFVNKVNSIQPIGLNIFGTGIAGMQGASLSSRGGSTESDLLLELKRGVHKLAKLVIGKGKKQEINQQEELVFAQLRTCAVVGIITGDQLDALIEELNNLE